MSSNDRSERQREQVELNFKAFSEKLPELIKDHEDKYALMRNAEIIQICDSLEDAHMSGWERFEDELFSIQKITDAQVDLGFFSSHVLNIGQLRPLKTAP